MQMETGDSPQRTEELLNMRLHQNEALELGALENGLRYVILPNRSPPSRFEAHLEIHAGSGGSRAALQPGAKQELDILAIAWLCSLVQLCS